MENILENLNPSQLEAVTSMEGYIRVIAGAGSGKTRALTHQGNSIYFKGSKSIFKKKSGLRAAINIIRFLLNLPY